MAGTYRVRGIVCSSIELCPGGVNNYSSTVYKAQSLEHFGTRICIDGDYWMPSNSGIVLGWVEAK